MDFVTAVLLPCNASDPQQAWSFPAGRHTVTAVVNAASGLALALANSTLLTGPHGGDASGPDASCGYIRVCCNEWRRSQRGCSLF